DCNISWVEEFYANALGYAEDDYTSTVRGTADYCWASQPRFSAHTDQEYAEILQTLALPGRDWHYNTSGGRFRLQITDMMPAAKGCAK
ncbi:hypothetical protein A2U01_0059881, partial [Trifolium medium]|nr:hypothetical protein [Trifolium medium]